ncbi:MAG: 16S rRNA (uracil(1498)-N(3))-methyltransferase, partial [Hydrogenophaga sp.]|nr:16S rRNA (uracil(1498)-N(3))-methyltransferase [Hydrogenophaga sp.]
DSAARAAGFVPVTLGPRVLRAETAALAALVLAQSAA